MEQMLEGLVLVIKRQETIGHSTVVMSNVYRVEEGVLKYVMNDSERRIRMWLAAQGYTTRTIASPNPKDTLSGLYVKV